jgi:polysaccharide pyruvyl transferase WcaK-like protein
VRHVLGTDALAPYLAPPEWQPRGAPVLYVGVGGVDLAARDAAMQAEVRRRLAAADVVTVRDGATLAWTRANGIAARLVPDPVATLAQCFGERIARHAGGEVARARSAHPAGYVALQFSAEFGDDATLAGIASELDEALAGSALGVVCFRAGAAPWHDDARLYRRLSARLHAPCSVSSSLNIWDLCSLIAGARICCASSLHARIVATAFGVPRLSIGPNPKCAAYAASWEAPGLPQVVPVEGIAAGVRAAMAADPADLRRIGDDLAARFVRDFDAVIRPALPPR